MTDTPTCARCTRPTAHDGATLCTSCLDQLFADLKAVPELYEDLLVTRTKQDVISTESSRVSGSKERPLGYRPGAMAAAEDLTIALRYWARVIAGEWEQRLHRAFVAPEDPTSAARWLRCNPNVIRYSQHGAEIVDQISYAVARARRVCDRPAERRYAGACRHCATDLYVREQAAHITCAGCGHVYRSDERYGELLAELRDRNATAAEIAAGVGRLSGTPIDRKAINQWHSRGRLISRGQTPEGYPMFRIGDVLDLARRSRREKSHERSSINGSKRPAPVSPCTC